MTAIAEPKENLSPVKPAGKFEEFEKLCNESGDERMIELAAISRKYIEGLNHIFRARDVIKLVLESFDFPMFIKEMAEEGVFDKHKNLQGKVLMMDVFYIARHLWESVDEYGKLKTGEDLRAAWPLMFEDEKIRPAEQVFADLKRS